MVAKEQAVNRKLTGAYYTPEALARAMVSWVTDPLPGFRVLEPSCGDGVFLKVLSEVPESRYIDLDAVEVDTAEAEKAASAGPHFHVHNMDFFKFISDTRKQYDLVIGNPPYIRYQYLTDYQQEQQESIMKEMGLRSNKMYNAWAGFLAACIGRLSPAGTLSLILPSELLRASYAAELRGLLAERFSAITIVAFKDTVFPDAEQDTVVLVAQNGFLRQGIRVIELEDLEEAGSIGACQFQCIPGFKEIQDPSKKWTKYFLSEEDNLFLSQISKKFRKLSDYATLQVGITTGNNNFFVVCKKTAEEYGLQDFCRPVLARSAFLRGATFTEEDWAAVCHAGKPAYLLDIPDAPDYPEGCRRYIQFGEEAGVQYGYKCRIRDKWYRVPSIWTPDAFFQRRCGTYPKFALNRCKAVCTDSVNRIHFNPGVEPERVVLGYYNSLSFAAAEMYGRSFAGGALEVLPGEAGNIPIPDLSRMPMEQVRDVLSELDCMMRRECPVEEILDFMDERILIQEAWLTHEQCQRARGIWKRLQERRLRGKGRS